MIKGIDVSTYQGTIDWAKVKADGIEFVMIRAGYGDNISQIDPMFITNINGAKANNIPCGAYWFSYAKDATNAELEAKIFMEVIKDYTFEYPVCYDFESGSVEYLKQQGITVTKAAASANATAFLTTLEQNDYYAMNYANLNFLTNYYDDTVNTRFDLWYARPGISAPDRTCGIWQADFNGSVDGITTAVDIDYAYKDYPSIIKSRGLNGFKRPIPENPKSIITVTAQLDNKIYKGTLTET